jgi:hypothetical protein
VSVHSLSRSFTLPDNLREFTPTLFWMDQRNSTILYDSEGKVVTEPTDPVLKPDNTVEPFMDLLAGPNTDLYGLIYLPRGAYLDMQGSTEWSLRFGSSQDRSTSAGPARLTCYQMPPLRS